MGRVFNSHCAATMNIIIITAAVIINICVLHLICIVRQTGAFAGRLVASCRRHTPEGAAARPPTRSRDLVNN